MNSKRSVSALRVPALRTRTLVADTIAENVEELANTAVVRQYREQPCLDHYGKSGRARCIEDSEYHLEFLIDALQAGEIKRFVDYCAWAKILLHSRGIDLSHFVDNLKHLLAVLRSKLSKPQYALAATYVQAALKALPSLPTTLPTFIAPHRAHSDIANSYLQALLLFQRERASEIILKAASSGVSVQHIYQHIITPVQHEVGRLWQLGQLTVAHEHYCTAATEIVMAELFRHLVITSPPHERRVMCFCVEGERHCVGLKMFADLLRVEGWESIYIGQDTPSNSVMSLIAKHEPKLVAISVTFARNLRALRRFIMGLRARAEGKAIKVLIGGRATSQEVCNRVGADGFADNIGDGVEVASRLAA